MRSSIAILFVAFLCSLPAWSQDAKPAPAKDFEDLVMAETAEGARSGGRLQEIEVAVLVARSSTFGSRQVEARPTRGHSARAIG